MKRFWNFLELGKASKRTMFQTGGYLYFMTNKGHRIQHAWGLGEKKNFLLSHTKRNTTQTAGIQRCALNILFFFVLEVRIPELIFLQPKQLSIAIKRNTIYYQLKCVKIVNGQWKTIEFQWIELNGWQKQIWTQTFACTSKFQVKFSVFNGSVCVFLQHFTCHKIESLSGQICSSHCSGQHCTLLSSHCLRFDRLWWVDLQGSQDVFLLWISSRESQVLVLLTTLH